jgi:hypothetical protein
MSSLINLFLLFYNIYSLINGFSLEIYVTIVDGAELIVVELFNSLESVDITIQKFRDKKIIRLECFLVGNSNLSKLVELILEDIS